MRLANPKIFEPSFCGFATLGLFATACQLNPLLHIAFLLPFCGGYLGITVLSTDPQTIGGSYPRCGCVQKSKSKR
ncbi:hypothetical protein MPNT_60139 [Candidatus Methylacidithermus pantelleriae]|uniref:Uncharacterized protein n=1 Tax=Candidatus Methylacidithermus pantelleriae TaxID=2744239 RepID=A0A8J2BLU3_9BACT|nr:hypothetical protein MPNT_60139 [Candidatus Methylacidithermus pantelleriae]